jgi:hypothetical protein
METWLGFAGTVIGSLAWPLCIFIVVLLFKKDIRSLLGRLTSTKIKDFEATFADQNVLSKEIAQKVKQRGITVSSGDISAKVTEIANINPSAAVLYAYSQLEMSVRDKVKQIDPLENTYLVNNMPRLLFKKQRIDQETFELLNKMRQTRNAVGHENVEIDLKDAVKYGNNIDQLLNIIKTI